jgi:hypothetical protein
MIICENFNDTVTAGHGQPGPKIPGRAGSSLHAGPGLGLIPEPKRKAGPGRALSCRKHALSLDRAGLVGLGWARAQFVSPKVGPGRARAWEFRFGLFWVWPETRPGPRNAHV